MKVIKQQIPQGTKVYSTFARCCRYAQRLPSGVQPVSNANGEHIGFAALAEKQGADYVSWVA